MTFDAWEENEKVNFEGVFFLMRNGPDSFSFVCGARKAMVITQGVSELFVCFFSGPFCPLKSAPTFIAKFARRSLLIIY